MTAQCVFLFDVDNTLIDNDRLQADLSAHLTERHGAEVRDRYWAIFETLRAELGYADYLGALERYRLEDMHDPAILQIAPWLVDYPFARLGVCGWYFALLGMLSALHGHSETVEKKLGDRPIHAFDRRPAA